MGATGVLAVLLVKRRLWRRKLSGIERGSNSGLMVTTSALRSFSRLRERVGKRVSAQRDNPQEEEALTGHARDDASHRPGAHRPLPRAGEAAPRVLRHRSQ